MAKWNGVLGKEYGICQSSKAGPTKKDGVIVAQRVTEDRHVKVLKSLLQPFACAALLA